MNTSFIINKKIKLFSILILIPMFLGCDTPEEKLQNERKEAAKEIGTAAQKVDEVVKSSSTKIAEAPNTHAKEERKIEATEDLADAKEKLHDEKVEATEEIAEAKATAGQGGSYTKHD